MEPRPPSGARPHAARGPQRVRPPRARLASRADRRPLRRPPARMVRLVRLGVPALVVVAGLVSIGFGTTASVAGGCALIGAGLSIAFAGWLFRIGVEGDHERAVEERARREFARTGRWPGR